MSDHAIRRSRPSLLTTAILLAIVLSIAWFIYSVLPDRRLNPLEKQFLGQWSFPRADNPKIATQISFRSDRIFELSSSDGATGSGTWEANDGGLLLSLKDEDQVMPRFLPKNAAWYVRGSYIERFIIVDFVENQAWLRTSGNEILVLK